MLAAVAPSLPRRHSSCQVLQPVTAVAWSVGGTQHTSTTATLQITHAAGVAAAALTGTVIVTGAAHAGGAGAGGAEGAGRCVLLHAA